MLRGHARFLVAGQFLPEDSGIAGEAQASFQVDQSRADQFGDFRVEMLHAFAFAGFQTVEKRAAGPLALLDTVARARIRFQDFHDGDSVAAIGARNQALRDDVAECLGQPLAHRLLFGSSERGNDPFHRF